MIGDASAARTTHPAHSRSKLLMHSIHLLLSPLPLGVYRRIIASCFWILAALGHLLHAFGTAAAVTVAGKRPGIAAWTLVAAWMQLIATVIVLIGACIFAGGTLGAVSAGAV